MNKSELGEIMHQHAHEHQHGTSGQTPEQRNAVLTYMLEHNQHHAEELHELGHQVEGQASDLIHDAVDLFKQSNEKLEAALRILKGQE